MAFNTTADRAIKISVNLNSIIEANLDAVVQVRKRDRAEKEAKFQQIVIDQGLTYDAQIAYRKQQIEEEKTKPNTDTEYISTLETGVRDLKKLNRFKKVREDYLASYDSLKAGKINLQQHADFLNEQLMGAQSEDERTEIRSEITNVRTQIAQAEIDTLNNRVLVAQKDGTVDILNKTIDDVAKRKAFAELAGNTEESSMWDVSLTSLRKQLNETAITNAIHDIDFNITRKGLNAIDRLDALNVEINKSDANTPVTVGGIKYNSAKDYWTGKRDSYIAGTGDDSNFQSFFKDFESEVKDKVDTVSAVNKFGFVPVPTLEAIQTDYNNLSNRAEFAPQLNKLTTSKTAALAYGVEKSAGALVDSSVQALQLQSGTKTLENLESKFGIDLTAKKVELQSKIIEKGAQLPSIKAATEELGKVGAETPPTEIKPSEEPGAIFKQTKGTEAPKPAGAPAVVPTPAPEATPTTTPPTAPQFREVTIAKGETLSGIAQRELGNAGRYKEIAELNKIADPNKIFAGAKLKIPTL